MGNALPKRLRILRLPERPMLPTLLLLGCLFGSATTGWAQVGITFVEFEKDGVGGVDGLLNARNVDVSPDGAHLYVASGGDQAVAVFSRNTTTGALTFVEAEKDGVDGVDGLTGAFDVTVSPDGAHVYATGFGDDAVAVFSRNAATGALTFVEAKKDGVGGVDGLDGPRRVVVSPDGAHVYVAGQNDNAVAVFSRNGATGALTFVEAKKDGAGGVDGLAGVREVIVSPDGAQLYASGFTEDAVAVFSRNTTTGALAFVQVLKNGVGGVAVLDGPQNLVLSPDGDHLYVTAVVDDAIVLFSRNATTGALTYVEAVRDGVGGFDGLDVPNALNISPDGTHLYAGGNEQKVLVVRRDTATGALTPVELEQEGGALNTIFDIVMDPSGLHVYVTSYGNHAVSVYASESRLPVELVSFTGVADGRDVLLRWETASEQNNAGFGVEVRRAADARWTTVASVEGRGTTSEAQRYAYRVNGLAAGTYRFRLKQTDFDGSFSYSPEVEVQVGLPGAFALSEVYPNPFNPQARFTLAVQEAQQVRVELTDLLGRRVALLHDGPLAPGATHSFMVEGKGLPSGMYLIRATGEQFSSVRSALLVK